MTTPSRILLRNIDWKFLFSSLAVFAILASAGWWYYEDQRGKIIRERQEEIIAIAEAKEDRIARWREERLLDARILFNNPFTRRVVTDLVRGRATQQDRADLASWLVQAEEILEYTGIGVFDRRGQLVMGVGPTVGRKDPFVRAYLDATVQAREMRMTDIYRNQQGEIVIEIYRPIFDFSAPPEVVGTLLLRIDPREGLYPLIQTWPTPSKTFELILFTRTGDDALVLNELRHRKGTALNLLRPAADFGLPRGPTAWMVEDAFEDVDYRGVPVLAALRQIRDTNWFLLAKEDQEEVYKPLRDFQEFVVAVMGLVFLVSGIILVIVWFKRRGAERRKAA